MYLPSGETANAPEVSRPAIPPGPDSCGPGCSGIAKRVMGWGKVEVEGEGLRLQTVTPTMTATSKAAKLDIQTARRRVIIAFAGPISSGEAAFPESESRFSRARSARISAAFLIAQPAIFLERFADNPSQLERHFRIHTAG